MGLETKRCMPCENIGQPLASEQIDPLMKELNSDWQLISDKTIQRKFKFKNYYQTMAFVNAVAWIAHTENHHPDLQVSYNYCIVTYSTHALKGLTENDFICAKKVDETYQVYR